MGARRYEIFSCYVLLEIFSCSISNLRAPMYYSLCISKQPYVIEIPDLSIFLFILIIHMKTISLLIGWKEYNLS
jgi:hypothetical protein